MKRAINALVLLAIGLLAPSGLRATHLVGGNLGYVYLGETFPGSQVYRYEVTMEFYMNCGPNSNFQTFQELLDQSPNGTLPVGVYRQDPQNPNANKVQEDVVGMELISEEQIIPDFPANCSVGQGLCTLRGLFSGTVDLPLSFAGYHLYFQMCCRNLDIDNLNNPNNTGIGYYAFIPPTLVQNSSPTFLGIPTPLLCISDTTTFINSASDPDGDQLIFSFETPYNSVTQQGGVQAPPGQLPWPVPEVTYAPGFSITQPFGVGGYSFINGATGLTEYRPVTQGNYVVAVEVKEFRNGQLIGRTRRDLQLQAVACPANEAPEVNGPLPTSYSVNAGEQLCFPLEFIDLDNDSVTLTASGTLFDGGIFSPPATIQSPVSGEGNVGAQFCWDTSCEQGQDQPYLFSVSVLDNGCPPKSVDVVFQVNVVPFDGPSVINGPSSVCTGQTGVGYSTTSIPGATITWTVNGGSIVSGQGTSAIIVNWGASGAGSVLVSATNAIGCSSAPASISVNIAALPSASAGADRTICPGVATVLGGTPTGPNGSSFSWTPSGSLDNAGIANPTATPPTTTDYVVTVSNAGCIGRDTVRVSIGSPAVDAGEGQAYCTGGSAQLNATGAGTFAWQPADGLSATDIADPVASPTTTTTYTVTLTDGSGCSAVDSVTVTVNTFDQSITLTSAEASGCQGDTTIISAIPDAAGNTYAWAATGSITLTGTLGNSVIAEWGAPGAGSLVVEVTDANGCSATFDASFESLALPDVDAGPDTSICAGQSVQLNGSGSGTLVWSPIAGLSDPNIPDPVANPEVTQVYTLTVTGGNLCTNSDQTTVTVNVLPNANAGPDLVLCAGDSVQLEASGPGTYSWSPAATLSDPNATNPLAFPTSTTTYTLTLTDSVTCSATDAVTVTVTPRPNAGTDGSDQLCGAGLTFFLGNYLGGNPNGNGTWSDPNGALMNGFYTPGVSPSGIYTYVVVGGPGCANDTATVTITETAAPEAGEDAFVQLCSNGAPVDLFTALGGTPDAGGTWQDVNGVADDGIFDPAVDASNTFIYRVTGTPPCSDAQATVTVVVNAAPDPGANAELTLCESGLPFNMTQQLGGTPAQNGTWTDPNGDPHGNEYSPALDTPGVWTYTVDGGFGCPDSSATLTITEVTNADAGQDAFLQLCSSSAPVDLFTVLGGTPDAGGTWQDVDGVPFDGTFDPAVDATNTFIYRVTGTPPCSDAQATVIVIVNPALDPGSDATTTACGSGPAFNMTDLLGGTPDPNGSWQDPAGNAHGATFDPAVDPAGTWIFVVTGGNGCPDTSAALTINLTDPDTTIDGDGSICIGETTQLVATGANVAWAWSPNVAINDTTVQSPLVNPLITTTYTVLVTDAAGCTGTGQITVTVNALPVADAGPNGQVCAGGTVQIGGSPTSPTGTGYLWSPAGGLDQPGDPNPDATPGATTTYTVTVTDANGCAAQDSTTVTVIPLPALEAGPDTGLCQGSNIQLNATGSGSFNWSPATGLNNPDIANPTAQPSVTTTYTVTLTANGCVSTDQLTITLLGLPNADAGDDRYLCPGFDVQLQGSGGGAASWSPAATLSDPSILAPLASPTSTTTYTLTITDGNGCSATDDVTVQVNTDPPADAGPDVAICAGEQVTIGGSPTNIPGTTVVWTPAAGLSDPNASNPVASPAETTAYIVTVTSDTCTSQDIVLVTLQGIAEAAFNVRLEPACDGMRAFFTSTGGSGSEWQWDFGDGATSTEQNPQHYFAYGQPITVTLTVTDGLGCTSSITQSYPIADFAELVDYDMPNVFTPNGDGVNDVFTLNSGLNSNAVLGPCASMQVFNRWGQKVFQSQGNNLVWDGRNFAGELCTVGTYFWTLSVNDLNFNGDVYLNR
jgi:gliding motility-associated-like protein